MRRTHGTGTKPPHRAIRSAIEAQSLR